MTEAPRSRWPWLLWGLASRLGLAAIRSRHRGTATASTDTLVFLPVVLLTILGYATVGAILASRNTRNPIGWSA